MDNLQSLLREIRGCQLCRSDMTRPPNPIVRASTTARIVIAGQAPGNLADVKSKPFADPSGVRLRDWMGIGEAEFYDEARIAVIPMGFCFPGYDANGGDLPPMKVCARTWRERLFAALPNVELTLAVGGYAQQWHLGASRSPSMTETVARWREHIEQGVLPLPHPSWRNNAWLKRNEWFEAEIVPELRRRVGALLG